MNYKNLCVSCVVCKKQTTTSGLANHFNRIHGTDEAKKARANLYSIAAAKISSMKAYLSAITRCKEYSLNPGYCEYCDTEKDYFKRKYKYCSASCGTSSSNTRNPKRSNKVRLFTDIIKKPTAHKEKRGKFLKVCFHKCTQCDSIILSRAGYPARKTCSRKCQTNASVGDRTYINGKRKNIYYTHKDGSQVHLESSWELEIAQFLDENNIEWIRPKYIIWIDSTGKHRNYYPDFYLPSIDLYLDPKNPYAMAQDIEKMNYISSKVNLLYGNKDMIKKELSVRVAGFEPAM